MVVAGGSSVFVVAFLVVAGCAAPDSEPAETGPGGEQVPGGPKWGTPSGSPDVGHEPNATANSTSSSRADG